MGLNRLYVHHHFHGSPIKWATCLYQHYIHHHHHGHHHHHHHCIQHYHYQESRGEERYLIVLKRLWG